ncbi:uncharacterized protein BXZ73DRAFT_87406 [Epithele typhae]|uniref:uncharacterized protein n=1 Tax=Epithele typhae TaxID=378194 RepID=UPI002008D19F|nr:uncharacterized protein BXZ73DRAFT_87406 [Epithele typhae]KAH9944525.1 hypothetical protein BXZ73DRAFT_87406 [Epithele typhae]
MTPARHLPRCVLQACISTVYPNDRREPTPTYAIPIPKRPRRTWWQTLHGTVFLLVFFAGCIMINAAQIVLLFPLKLLYYEGIRYTKGAFGALLVLASQWFGPTKLIISFETEGQGKFTREEIERLVVRDSGGRVIALDLPRKTVVIGNHQNSLKWMPILGWGMQFFNFIFLARSWASDRLQLAASLSWLARRAEEEDSPLTFILYPEGTLVSKDTRPISKKYADKLGIPDMTNMLLPRSTGLHYSLRALAPRIPSLQLLDITMAYPGVPHLGYGQSYYTLRSIFCDRTPPPAVHMHLRKFDIARGDVPIGAVSVSAPAASSSSSAHAHTNAPEVELPEGERDAFELWLRALWREKDKQMDRYLESGFLSDAAATVAAEGGPCATAVVLPVRLRRAYEVLDAFCFFVPALVSWAWAKVAVR